MREYHVAVDGCDRQEGTNEAPFCTISKAAGMAEAGDRIIVHEEVYREWVKPMNGGPVPGPFARLTEGYNRIRVW